MNRWLFRRAASAAGTFLLAATLLFFLMRLTPGDPLLRLTEDRPMSPAALANLRAQQRAFDRFRWIYNEERPHDALGDLTPMEARQQVAGNSNYELSS